MSSKRTNWIKKGLKPLHSMAVCPCGETFKVLSCVQKFCSRQCPVQIHIRMEKSRNRARIKRGTKPENFGTRGCAGIGAKPNPYKVAARLIMDEYRKERHALRPTDESRHWLMHPLRIKFLVSRNAAKHSQNKSNEYLANVLRARIYGALYRQGQNKNDSTTKLLGCSITQFRAHIKSQFKRGMNWSNHGKVWHIDHLVPCSAFDLSDPEQQRRAFHFSNQRPLSVNENLTKHARIVTCQPELTINFVDNF